MSTTESCTFSSIFVVSPSWKERRKAADLFVERPHHRRTETDTSSVVEEHRHQQYYSRTAFDQVVDKGIEILLPTTSCPSTTEEPKQSSNRIPRVPRGGRKVLWSNLIVLFSLHGIPRKVSLRPRTLLETKSSRHKDKYTHLYHRRNPNSREPLRRLPPTAPQRARRPQEELSAGQHEEQQPSSDPPFSTNNCSSSASLLLNDLGNYNLLRQVRLQSVISLVRNAKHLCG